MPSRPVTITCPSCGKDFIRTPSDIKKACQNSGAWRCKACAMRIAGRNKRRPVGSRRTLKRTGYTEIRTPDGWMRENRYVMEQVLRRKLRVGEIVHHVDGDKKNNNPSNLELLLHGEHTTLHHTGKKRSATTRLRISTAALNRTCHVPRKLTEDKVRDIRERYAAGTETYNSLAEEYGVTCRCIATVIKRITWRKVA